MTTAHTHFWPAVRFLRPLHNPVFKQKYSMSVYHSYTIRTLLLWLFIYFFADDNIYIYIYFKIISLTNHTKLILNQPRPPRCFSHLIQNFIFYEQATMYQKKNQSHTW